MLCQECGQKPATVHYSQIINGHQTELHLCADCAKEKGYGVWSMEPTFYLNQLLAGLLHQDPIQVGAGLKCDLCGLGYDEFARTGKLGCGRCYTAFGNRLEPLIRRIQGSSVHAGKVPRRTGGRLRLKRELQALKRQLQEHVAREEFERAAELRDQIRELEERLKEGK